MIVPSPFISSLVPGKEYNPERHVAFGTVFLEKVMSDRQQEIDAVTEGAGLPDRGDQGWIRIHGVAVAGGGNDSLWGKGMPGTGRCRESLPDISDEPVDIYFGEDDIWLGITRTGIPQLVKNLQAVIPSVEIVNETDNSGRIAVMGPDSVRLLEALDIAVQDLEEIGNHLAAEILDEPVRICRSDFAGDYGYDFIIPIGPFNMILAVICSWGVRLNMNLLPVGWEAIQILRSKKTD